MRDSVQKQARDPRNLMGNGSVSIDPSRSGAGLIRLCRLLPPEVDRIRDRPPTGG
jgi:hypothetical protein